MTESRKVQEIRGSYYLYLPKSWCKENQVKKNQEISIDVLEDNTLLLSNKVNPSKLIGKISIDLDEWEHENTDISYLIFSCYVCGADNIIIKSNRKIKLKLRQEIDHMAKDLIDLEVFEENDNQIILKSLGQNADDVQNIFQRMLNNVLYMLEQISGIDNEFMDEDTQTWVKEKAMECAEILKSRYNNVKRFSLFIERGIHMLLRNRDLMRKLKWSVDDSIFNLMVTKYTEAIGGHCSKIAELFTKLDQDYFHIQKIALDVYEIYKESIIVYQFGNMIEAAKIFSNHNITSDKIEASKNTYSTEINLMLYHLQRIVSYSRRIAEIAVHKYISKTVASSRKEILAKPKIIE
ncbi:MAG: hypothetical protein ACTSPY_15230 [Candidatus Helarchaeota archaeon]